MAEEQDLREGSASAENMPNPLAAARVHLAEGRLAEAVKLLEELVKREPGNARAHEELALAQLRCLHYVQAMQAARRALELDPALHWPHGVLARVAIKAGRYGEAEGELEAQMAALPTEDVAERANAHNAIAALYFRQRRYDEAAVALDQAVTLEPLRAVYRFNLAMLYLRTRQADEAVAQLEILLDLPEPPADLAHTAHFNLGHLYARRGRYGDAREQFARALELRRTFLGLLFRAVPFLAYFEISTLLIVVLVVLLVLYLFLRR